MFYILFHVLHKHVHIYIHNYITTVPYIQITRSDIPCHHWLPWIQIVSTLIHYQSAKRAVIMRNCSVHTMEAWRGADVSLNSFISSELDGVMWSASGSGRFTSMERTAGIRSVGIWMRLCAGLEASQTDC